MHATALTLAESDKEPQRATQNTKELVFQEREE